MVNGNVRYIIKNISIFTLTIRSVCVCVCACARVRVRVCVCVKQTNKIEIKF